MYWYKTTAGRKRCKTEAVWKRQGSRKIVRDGKKRWRRCKMWRCNTDTFTHRRSYTKRFYTQTPLHTGAFTHRRFYTQAPILIRTFTHTHRFYTQTLLHTQMSLHTDTFTHRRFYTQTLFHTDSDSFPHRHFYTQTLLHILHIGAFTHRRMYTRTLLHRCSYTQTLLHTDAFHSTHRRFYTQTLLHTDAFTQRRFYTDDFYTQTLLNTDNFTHRSFYTQTLLHTDLLLHTHTVDWTWILKVIQWELNPSHTWQTKVKSIKEIQRSYQTRKFPVPCSCGLNAPRSGTRASWGPGPVLKPRRKEWDLQSEQVYGWASSTTSLPVIQLLWIRLITGSLIPLRLFD